MRVLAFDTTASLAGALAALDAPGPLPARTVVVPSDRHAHALRRALARGGHGRVLAGARLVGPLTAAEEVLRGAGVPFSPGEEALRPARLVALFRGDLPLGHFDPALLRTALGWDEAFARAIGDLEAAGLSPEDLPQQPAQARDLALVWTRVAAEAGRSLTAARICAEAAALLEASPAAWPFDGPALAVVTGHEDAALARFVRAIPGAMLAVRRARPLRPRHLARVAALFGPEARAALEAPPPPLEASPPGARPTERDLLAAFLFEDPEVLAASDRPRSRGRDGTVELEEHAGVEAELEAAAGWVARMVLEERLPLEEIAVFVPAQDPLAQLVADRLARLPLAGGALPVHVAGGIPAVATAGGARVLAVVRALRAHLSAASVAEVLPALRLEEAPDPAPPRSHLSHGEAVELAFSLGTAGGNAARPEGALEWPSRAAARLVELQERLARARRDEDSSARERDRIERTLESLRAARPALDALSGVARAILDGAPLAEVWRALEGFLSRWLLVPGDGAAVPAMLADDLTPACGGGGRAEGQPDEAAPERAGGPGGREPGGRVSPRYEGSQPDEAAPERAGAWGAQPHRALQQDRSALRLAGEDALAFVEERLRALRVARGRFGGAAVHVGSVASAAGLDFSAVRVVGLCEGLLPSAPQEDPVLPGPLRAALEAARPGRVLPLAEDRVLSQLHALDAAVRGARAAIVLSAPRVDLARTQREPAAVFVEAAAALGRPATGGAEQEGVIPDLAALRRDAFAPARASAAEFAAEHPISEAAWEERVARAAPELPPSWRGALALDLPRVEALRREGGPLGPGDGLVDPSAPFPAVPGLDPARPISASGLQDLLACPRMFLMKRVLGWREPASAPPLRALDAAAYGSLLHGTLEEIYRRHGDAIVARREGLARWQAEAAALADRAFDAFLSEVPLLGDAIREKERARLRADVRAFLAYDWEGSAGRRFVGVEVGFGQGTPLRIDLGGATLHVAGFIDRVDATRGATLVRDVKSGTPHPRRGEEAGPTMLRDVQLGVYLLAARALAASWGTPPDPVGAYVYPNGRGETVERSFVEDAEALEARSVEWLRTAAEILAGRRFAPTADEEDCRHCPFRPLCGKETPRRTAAALAEDGDGPLARLRALKEGDEEEA